MLVDRGCVVLQRIAEEEASLRREIVEPLRARLQQFEYRVEPRVPIAEVLVAPDTGLLERRFEPARELVRGDPHEMLLIEPVELLGIEDRVSPADPFERERRDQLIAREQLAIVAGRPA